MKKHKILAFLIVICLLFSVIGCGENDKQAQSTDKVMRYSLTSSPASMDPTTTSELFSYYIVRQMYNGLTDRTPEGNLKPGLAEKWEMMDNGKRFRFTLTKGIKFHSGKELTAKDVKYTFESILDPGHKAGDGISFLTNIVGAEEVQEGKENELKGFKILGDYKFEINLVEPDVCFPDYCAVECLYIVDGEAIKDKGDNWWESFSAGTGPFKLKSYTRDQKIVFEANSEYWRGRPQIDELEIQIVPSEDTALSMYEKGQLDMCDVPVGQLERVKEDANLSKELKSFPFANMSYLGFNHNLYAPFKDKRVRQAINLVIDRKKMTENIMAGAAYPLYGAIPVGFSCYDKDLPEIPYNPEQARELLYQAGYDKNNPLPPLKLYCFPMDDTNGSYIISQLQRELGMEVELVLPDRAKILADLRNRQLAFFLFGCTADYGDARTILGSVFHSKGGRMNASQYSNSEFDKLLDQAAIIADSAERGKIYREAERVLMSDWACAPLYTDKSYVLIKPNVKDVPLSPLGLDTFERVKIQEG